MRRLDAIGSQVEDTLLSIQLNPDDTATRKAPTILEDLISQVGQVLGGVEEVRQLVTGGRPEMTEPFFFDCLTNAQLWSLFDAGVLHGCMLPVEVYERLERIAAEHGCYLFTWPADVALPSLHDIVPGCAVPAEEPLAQTPSARLETPLTVERMHSAIEAFCARMHTDMPPGGRRIHVISTNPRPELRAGPYLEPQARDLTAMSLPELEAYLDDVLRVDEGHQLDSADSSARR